MIYIIIRGAEKAHGQPPEVVRWNDYPEAPLYKKGVKKWQILKALKKLTKNMKN